MMEDQGAKVIAEVVTKTDTPKEKEKIWNSLEVAKIIVSTFMPLVIAYIGWRATEQANDREKDRIVREEAKSKAEALAKIASQLTVASETYAFDFDEVDTIVNNGGSFKYKAFEAFQIKYGTFAAKTSENLHALRPLLNNEKQFDVIRSSFNNYVLETSSRLFRCLQPVAIAMSSEPPPLAAECNFVRDTTIIRTCAPYIEDAIRSHDSLPIKVPANVVQMCAQNSQVFVLDTTSTGAPPIPASPPAFH